LRSNGTLGLVLVRVGEHAVAGVAALGLRGDDEVAVVEAERRDDDLDVARVDQLEAHAQLAVEPGRC
jgi:hypothetical protein